MKGTNFETLMTNILINAHTVGKQNANSYIDEKDTKLYLKAYDAALLLVAADLKLAFGRMNPQAKNMEVFE